MLFLSLCWWASHSQVHFIENSGQWPSEVEMMSEVPGGRMWFLKTGVRYEMFSPETFQNFHPANPKEHSDIFQSHVFDVRWHNGRSKDIEKNKPEPSKRNYYLGQNQVAKVSSYDQFEQKNIYPQIDLRWRGVGHALKYEWVIQPGGEPQQVVQQYAQDVKIKLEDGELIVQSNTGTFIEKAPFCYQFMDGKIMEVPSSFKLEGHQVQYVLGDYRHDLPLIIDPEIIFSTYVGSLSSTFGFTACNDLDGNLVSGGISFGQNYPTTPGAINGSFNSTTGNFYDIVISKFNTDGSQLLYSTFLGGSRQETPHSLVVNNDNEILILSVTGSSDFPTTANGYQTTFAGGPGFGMASMFIGTHPNGTDFAITKIAADGTLAASTLVGLDANDGINKASGLFYNYGDVFRGEINVDDNDNVYVASVTEGNFPIAGNPAQPSFGGGNCDGVFFKLDGNLSTLLYSSYYGGSGDDACYSIQFGMDGFPIICGGTTSPDFTLPSGGNDLSQNGNVDGFVIRIHPITFAGVSGTFIGTAEYDQAYFIQTDYNNNIYVLGQTTGNMAISPGCYGQVNSGLFVRKYNYNLSSLIWNTTIGTGSGEVDISPTAFLISDCEQIYFSGWGGAVNHMCGNNPYGCLAVNSTTIGLPISADAMQPNTDGSDFYLCVLSPNAQQLIYGSYYGGSNSSEHVDGGTSRFNKNGFVYQAVCAGCSGGDDFPTSPNAVSNVNPSTGCNVAVFKFSLSPIYAEADLNTPPQVCVNEVVSFNNASTGATQFQWFFGDGGTSSLFEPTHQYTLPGDYTVQLVASDNVLCLLGDTVEIPITIIPFPDVDVMGDIGICQGDSIQLVAAATDDIQWSPNNLVSDPVSLTPWAFPTGTTLFTATSQNSCGTAQDEVQITVYPVALNTSPDQNICLGQSANLSASGGATYLWTPPTGLSDPNSATPTASPNVTTSYTVQMTTAENCTATDTVLVAVYNSIPGPNTISNVIACAGAPLQLTAENALTYEWSPASLFSDNEIQNPIIYPQNDMTVSVMMTNSCGSGNAQIQIQYESPIITMTGANEVCEGDSLLLSANGGVNYNWYPADWVVINNNESVIIQSSVSGYVSVEGTDVFGCQDVDSLYVEILPLPTLSLPDSVYFEYPDLASVTAITNVSNGYWEPNINISCDTCFTIQAWPDYPTEYTFVISDEAGCGAQESVWIIPEYSIWVPNCFTPNEDGINDGFLVQSFLPLRSFEFQIFDRWGEKVFETKDQKKGWDGSYQGYYAPQDVYEWVLRFDNRNGHQIRKGHVTILH
jgi:gliding motility-associated-like protein